MSSIHTNYSAGGIYAPQTSGPEETGRINQPTDTSGEFVISNLESFAETPFAQLLAIRLQSPTVGLDDIQINEFLQQLESLDIEGFELLSNFAGLVTITQALGELLTYISNLGETDFQNQKEDISNGFGQVEQALQQAENSIYQMLKNSSYPNYADFMKEMLAVSQELRELAAAARHAAVQAEVKNIIEQAQTMMKAAVERFNATMAQITADRINAGMQVLSGTLTIISTGIGAGLGGGLGGTAGLSTGMQAGSGIGGALGSITTGIGSGISSAWAQFSAEHTKKADMLDAARKSMEAGLKLIQESQDMARDLSEAAKQLRDMVLSLYRDFIANQHQILQRANV